MIETTDLIRNVERIAEDVLFDRALETDGSELLSKDNLDVLADAGLYGLFGPRDLGGLAADLPTAGAVVERVASGCLTTALVWLQHHGLVGNLLMGTPTMRDRWLADVCSGRLRSGIVFTGLIAGPSSLHAISCDGGWTLRGHAPWVSGWGRVNMLQVAARGPEETVVTVVLEDLDRQGLTATRHELAVLDASGTVRLSFGDVFVPKSDVLSVVPYDPSASNGLSLRLNGSLALGVARRCCMLIGPSELDDQLDEVRRRLDSAKGEKMAHARALASSFASRASTTLLVHTGSRAIERNQHAQRLAREAMFLMVFGSRPAIREALLSYV